MSNLDDYIEQHSSFEPDYLQQINRDTNLHVLNAHMLSGHVQGRLLSLLSQMIRPTRILELGTFTGYSALCLAEGLADDGELITIEHNDELADTIRHNLSLSPLGKKIHLLLGDAGQILSTFDFRPSTLDFRPSTFDLRLSTFDLVFIDADKREYSTYLDLIYPYVRAGGWILADNTLWDGHVIVPAYDKDAQTLGLRAFNDSLARDARFDKVILPIRDGLTIIRKK